MTFIIKCLLYIYLDLQVNQKAPYFMGVVATKSIIFFEIGILNKILNQQ
jgi:hypothetical protein